MRETDCSEAEWEVGAVKITRVDQNDVGRLNPTTNVIDLRGSSPAAQFADMPILSAQSDPYCPNFKQKAGINEAQFKSE